MMDKAGTHLLNSIQQIISSNSLIQMDGSPFLAMPA
jgi:hypothetical protein